LTHSVCVLLSNTCITVVTLTATLPPRLIRTW